MLITRGYWPPFWLCVSPAEDRAFVHCRHLMTVILNTHRMLSRFCLHSYQNEVLGGPHLSITAGLQLFASLWPGFNSLAYKLSLNSVEQGPFNPLLSLSPDKCSSAASPRHMPPSYLLLSVIRWPALHSHMAHHELLYLRGCWKPIIAQGYSTLTAMIWIHLAWAFSPLYLWTRDYFAKAFCCFHNSASKLPMNCMNGQHMLVSTFFSEETLTNRGDNTFIHFITQLFRDYLD